MTMIARMGSFWTISVKDIIIDIKYWSWVSVDRVATGVQLQR